MCRWCLRGVFMTGSWERWRWKSYGNCKNCKKVHETPYDCVPYFFSRPPTHAQHEIIMIIFFIVIHFFFFIYIPIYNLHTFMHLRLMAAPMCVYAGFLYFSLICQTIAPMWTLKVVYKEFQPSNKLPQVSWTICQWVVHAMALNSAPIRNLLRCKSQYFFFRCFFRL